MKHKFTGMLFLCIVIVALFVGGCGGNKEGGDRTPKERETGASKATEQKQADIVVKEGESINDAVKKAKDGMIIEVEPGVYKETVTVDKHDITLRGVVDGDKRPVIEGGNKLNDGVIASGEKFTMAGFEVRNMKGNGVTTQGSDGVTLMDIIVKKTGLYGLYPVQSKNILIEKCTITGIKDAAIYVGESHDIVVKDNEVFGNVAGIEIENSTNAVVENNNAHDNTGGILVFALPNKVVKVCENVIVRNNKVTNNNVKNFGDPKSIIGRLPLGSGIILMAADTTTVENNEINGNESFGIAMIELDLMEDPKKDKELEPNPDRNKILNNTYGKNGTKAQGMVKEMLGKGADVIWSGAGNGNCAVKQKGITTIGAENLPQCKPAAVSAETSKKKRMKA